MQPELNPSKRIDKAIADLNDWRGRMLAEIRRIIHLADPEVTEEWKWMGSPVWEHNGIICIANAHKKWVKVTFAKGASISDPSKLFNAGLEGNVWRAINFFEEDKINEKALINLVRAAIKINAAKLKKKKPTNK